MKIFYDHFGFIERYGGVSKYFVEVFKRLPTGSWTLSGGFSENQYLKESNLLHTFSPFCSKQFRGKGIAMNYLNMPSSIFTAMRGDYDIYHQTHYNTSLFPLIRKSKKIVVCMHDLNYFVCPQLYPDTIRLRHTKKEQKKSAMAADMIIAVSGNTKKDLVEQFGIDEKKIKVIYHGIDKEKKKTEVARIVRPPYILFVGTRHTYKNFQGFVKAFSLMAGKYKDLNFACTGSSFTAGELAAISKLGLQGRAHCIFATEAQMAQLYHDAEMFAYPSFYEGFGIPLLEAMLYDCPVVCSQTSCFPEVAGEAARYFDPSSVEDMANAMQKVLDDTHLKSNLIRKGQARLQLYSWDKCAEEHLDLYHSLL
ncbi:MAG: glycosyltransferase family 4 protein [Prevotellaceae bacterium]|jgi:glycosyltransferase involved in cell wall biosynthesis|nr:glycosyltransferase family 4 protein [Prevotellaceae bacterium]